METNYKPNSHKFKEEQKASSEKKEITKVVSGPAKVKKKNPSRKIADMFISEDAANVKSYIMLDVIVPAIKDVVSNIVKDSIDMVLFGGTGGSKKRANTGNSPYISYNRFSDKRDRERERDRYHEYRGVPSRYDFSEISIKNKKDAEDVLERMDEIMDTYGMVKVADLFDLVGIAVEYTDNDYGWTNLRDAKVIRDRDGYVLDLPRIKSLR